MKRLLGSDAIVTLTRALAGLVGFLFLVVGLALLIMPEVVSTALFALSTTGVGINSLRADLGALFLGMSVFCLLGVFSNDRWLLVVPVVFLVFIVGGRLIGMSVDGFPTPMTGALVGELVFVLVLSLAVASQALSANPQPRPQALVMVLRRQFVMPVGVVLVLLPRRSRSGLRSRPGCGTSRSALGWHAHRSKRCRTDCMSASPAPAHRCPT